MDRDVWTSRILCTVGVILIIWALKLGWDIYMVSDGDKTEHSKADQRQ
jgi:hypothetical protein